MSPIVSILVAAGITSGVMTVFAALLVLAERIVNSRACEIDVNSGTRTLEVPGGQPLLSAELKSEGIFLPSACGGRGTCAYCTCRITEGGGPVGPTEAPLLTDEEQAHDVRISCQVKVRNDLSIVIPDALFLVKEFRGVIERIVDLTHDIKELRIRLIEPETIEFTPGQYIQLDVPPYGENPQSVARAYSIASVPGDAGCVELVIRLVPGGICTTWVFTVLKEGDEVTFNGPHGDFHLSESGAEMVWIAGGSGMAPFWSILRDMKARGVARPVTYFFGAVGEGDLFYTDELHALADELPWFRYVPALSCEVAGCPNWSGERGLITDVVARHVSDARHHIEGYLCGSPGMIDAAIKVLEEKGVTDEHIYYDKFA